MSGYLPCAIIVTDAAKAGAEIVMSAYRGGQVQFGIPLIAADTVDPLPSTPPTHWLMWDESLKQEHVVVYQGFANGDLPPLADPSASWGEEGLIGAAAAMSAVSGTNMQVYSASGEVVPTEFVDGQNGQGGILPGRNLMKRPTIEF